jgi:hypothetical protein
MATLTFSVFMRNAKSEPGKANGENDKTAAAKKIFHDATRGLVCKSCSAREKVVEEEAEVVYGGGRSSCLYV